MKKFKKKSYKNTYLRDAYLKKTYFNFSEKKYKAMDETQSGKCAICGIHRYDLGTDLFVDHDHETSKIRGLLCSSCNSGLGYFKDDIDIIRRAVSYLNQAVKLDVKIKYTDDLIVNSKKLIMNQLVTFLNSFKF
jgi:Recombination endonuclease VII